MGDKIKNKKIKLKNNRPSKENHYLHIAREISQRSTCFRVKIGAIIVKDDAIVATGYVGAPRKTKDCFEHGFCLRDQLGIPHGHRYEICRSVHAEMNCLINAARTGVSLLNGEMFIYGEYLSPAKKMDVLPCFLCKKMIINAGLKRVICSQADGHYKIFKVENWRKNWQQKDIVDDKYQYGVDGNQYLYQKKKTA
ncbi:MAG: dCMP deaminase family protein [Patescibacteria group bacterium]|nr:dCMP deaminase family protein [Patescibacteria group bacterium]